MAAQLTEYKVVSQQNWRLVVGGRRQQCAATKRVVVVVLVEALPSRVSASKLTARGAEARGGSEGPATVSYSSKGCAMTGRRPDKEGEDGSIRVDWSQGSHRGSMNALGSSVTKSRRVVKCQQNRGRQLFAGGRVHSD